MLLRGRVAYRVITLSQCSTVGFLRKRLIYTLYSTQVPQYMLFWPSPKAGISKQFNDASVHQRYNLVNITQRTTQHVYQAEDTKCLTLPFNCLQYLYPKSLYHLESIVPIQEVEPDDCQHSLYGSLTRPAIEHTYRPCIPAPRGSSHNCSIGLIYCNQLQNSFARTNVAHFRSSAVSTATGSS